MMDAGTWSGLMASDAVTWRRWQAKASSSHGVWVGFESHNRQAVGQTKKCADNATERVTRHPDIGVRIAFGDVVIQIASGKVVVTLLAEAFDQAR